MLTFATSRADAPRTTADVCPGGFPGDGGAGAAPEVYRPECRAEPRVLWRGLPKPWIAGTVIDPAGDEVIAGAAITSTDPFGNGSVTVHSDAFGDFWLRGLEKGRKYRIEIGKDGYEHQPFKPWRLQALAGPARGSQRSLQR